MPPVVRRERPAKQAQARTEISGISAAINQYFIAYNRFPIASRAQVDSNDFTFGTFGTSDEKVGITNSTGRQANNSEVMAILMDMQNFPNGSPCPNTNHSFNPQRIVFLNAKFASSTNSHGIGADG